MGFSAHEFWYEICPAQLFARMEIFQRHRDRDDARFALMPYLYRNAHRGKDEDPIPFEEFLPQYAKEPESPADQQSAIDAHAEMIKAQFLALARRMNQNKSVNGESN